MSALYRSKQNRIIAGVCGGIAEQTGMKAVGVRVIFAILALFFGITIIVYILMWLILESR